MHAETRIFITYSKFELIYVDFLFQGDRLPQPILSQTLNVDGQRFRNKCAMEMHFDVGQTTTAEPTDIKA